MPGRRLNRAPCASSISALQRMTAFLAEPGIARIRKTTLITELHEGAVPELRSKQSQHDPGQRDGAAKRPEATVRRINKTERACSPANC